MTRIADFPSSGALVNYLLNTQARLIDTQVQLSTQKKSTDYAGLAQSSQRLVTLENQHAQLDQFVTNNEIMDLRLKSTETVLGGIRDVFVDFREQLFEYESGTMTDEGRVDTIQEAAYRALQDLEVHLNTEIDGRFVFAGGRVTTEPVDFGLTTLADFQSTYDGEAVVYPQSRAAHVETDISLTAADTGDLTLASGPPATITAATAGSLSGITVGSTITLGGATTAGNNTQYTVVGIDATNTVLTLSGSYTIGATTTTITNAFANDETVTAGTIDVGSYYSGDTSTQTHRVATSREFSLDMNAIDPAFEKAIRAMANIAQGAFGTNGGLDKHPERVDEALYLINAAIDTPPTGTAPFGTEQTSSIDDVERTLGYQRLLIDQTNSRNKELMGFFDGRVSSIEDINELETVTALLEDQQALEASYKAFSLIRQLSLTNFM